MERNPNGNEERLDSVRRRFLRAGLVAGSGLALGHLPWAKPEVKSFFGVRSAYAQASALVVCTVSPTSLDFSAPAGPSSQRSGGSEDQSFTVTNEGNLPFDLTGVGFDGGQPSWSPFSIVSPMFPVTVTPGSSATVTIRYVCAPNGVDATAVATVEGTSDLGALVCDGVALSGACT